MTLYSKADDARRNLSMYCIGQLYSTHLIAVDSRSIAMMVDAGCWKQTHGALNRVSHRDSF